MDGHTQKKENTTVVLIVVPLLVVITDASCGCHGNLTRLLPNCRLLLSSFAVVVVVAAAAVNVFLCFCVRRRGC